MYSRVGRGEYRATTRNILLLQVSLDRNKYVENDMLTNQQKVLRIVFMKISAAIIEKSNFHYISANIADY